MTIELKVNIVTQDQLNGLQWSTVAKSDTHLSAMPTDISIVQVNSAQMFNIRMCIYQHIDYSSLCVVNLTMELKKHSLKAQELEEAKTKKRKQ